MLYYKWPHCLPLFTVWGVVCHMKGTFNGIRLVWKEVSSGHSGFHKRTHFLSLFLGRRPRLVIFFDQLLATWSYCMSFFRSLKR